MSFATVCCGLTTSAAELCQLLGKKFFLQDVSNFVMYLSRNNLERIMGAMEKPLFLQKRWLEQAGYTEEDNITEIGHDDNSYLFRFIFAEIKPPQAIKLPKEADAQLQHFDFQARNLALIPKVLYRYAPTMVSLNLSQNHSLEVPLEFLGHCSSLHDLRLSNNDYNIVPSSVSQLKTITNLDLSCNRLRELDHADLHLIEFLTTLKLQNNRLTDLPENLSQLKNLQTLYVSNNRMVTFPKVICNITSLIDLDLSFNKITSVPEEISSLVKLERLLMIGNRLLGSLPKAFIDLVELKELDLRQNSIQDLGVLGNMSSLVLLFLDYNPVSTLSCKFKSLKHLTLTRNHLTHFIASETPTTSLIYLNLSKSKLPHLPDSLFKQFPNLDCLMLNNNQLVSVPSSITELSRLTTLSMTNNSIANLPADIHRLSLLTFLDLHSNNLKVLPMEIWLLPSLITLNVSSNLLETLPDPPEAPKAAQNPVRSASLSSASTEAKKPTQQQRKEPVPLALSLKHLYMGDNRFTDDVFSLLAHFMELKSLNLSHNEFYDIPKNGFYNLTNLHNLYMSGNQITSLPSEEVGRLRNLRELFMNSNKLQTLPAELGKIAHLKIVDVGCNNLKYNISNWPYDWNWNWNRELKHLNLSGNKRLEIKSMRMDNAASNKNLSDFSSLSNLKILGLMDVTIMVSVPDETTERRVRFSPTEISHMRYGMSDTLGRWDALTAWDMVVPRFRNKDNEALFGLFDGRIGSVSAANGKVIKFLSDSLATRLEAELKKTNATTEAAIRRTFLTLNKDLGGQKMEDTKTGASSVMIYITGTTLYSANVGDALAVISRNGAAKLISTKHTPWEASEIARIQSAGGYVSHQGRLNDELEVSRSFGHFHLMPIVNANPFITKIELSEEDEFVIMASKGLWDKVPHENAVDIVRTERDDYMTAAQKLRDFAMTYGVDESIMVMVICVADLFDSKRKKLRTGTNQVRVQRPQNGMNEDMWNELKKSHRRGKENQLGDSTLARLEREVPAPTGQVALVFTDIKNSTFLWETLPTAMEAGIKIHNKIMRRFLRKIGGYEVKTEGDAFMVSFPSVSSALLWSLSCQLQLLNVDWPQEILDCEDGKPIKFSENSENYLFRGLSVRMGIHWGAPVCEKDPITNRMDYFGPMVNKSARISGIADGGQITVSQDVINEINEVVQLIDIPEDDLDPHYRKLRKEIIACGRLEYTFKSIGNKKLKGMENPEPISLVFPKSLEQRYTYVERKKRQSTRVLEPEAVRQIGQIALRLECMTGSRPGRDVPGTYVAKAGADDVELLRVTSSLLTRVENAISALRLRKVELRILELLDDESVIAQILEE